MLRLLTGFLAGFLSGWWVAPMVDARRRVSKVRRMVYKRRLARVKAKIRRRNHANKVAHRKTWKYEGGILPWLR